jgi:hypothetical protein
MNGSWRNEQHSPATDPFRSLRTLGSWLIGLLGLNAALDVVAAISDISYLGLIDRWRQGLVSIVEVASADSRQATLALLHELVFVATAIVLIVWFRRAYRNLGPLGASWVRFKPGWATGGWFVPIFNAVRPKEIANDIWRVSDPDLPTSLDGPALGRPVAPVVDLWWLAFIVRAALGRATFRVQSETLDQLASATRLNLVVDVWDILLSALAIVVVKQVTDRQELRWQRVSTARPAVSRRPPGVPPPPPPPAAFGP